MSSSAPPPPNPPPPGPDPPVEQAQAEQPTEDPPSSDPVWKHCQRTAKRNENICNYCKIKFSGGANRMKWHLSCIPRRDARPCSQVPQEVRRDMVAFLEAFLEKQQGRKRVQEEISRPPPFPTSSTTEEVQSSIGPRIRHGASSSGASGARADYFSPRSSPGSQPAVNLQWNKEKVEAARMAIAAFWYYSALPFNVARSPYWQNMVDAIAICGAGVKAPSYHDLRGPLLTETVNDVHRIVEEQRKMWKKKGCSILTDGWTDMRGRTLINYMVSSSGNLVFLKSVDASGHIKNADFLFTQLQEVITDVGAENVVQVVTDNAVAYVAAGRLLEEKFPHIFWSPCAAHCIDLLLEDLGKLDWVKTVFDTARRCSKYIYAHPWILHLMRTDYMEGKDIVRPGATRFATNFIALQSLEEARPALRQMFAGNKWRQSKFYGVGEGEAVEAIIFDEVFWSRAREILTFSEPLVRVLLMVDGDRPPMGYIYEAMDKAKEAITSAYSRQQQKYTPLWDAIDRRWTHMLHRHIHAAGYLLNPKFCYGENFEQDVEVSIGIQETVKRLSPDRQTMKKVLEELALYTSKTGYLFSSQQADITKDTLPPDQWWEQYGALTPNLKKMAIRILSQPCSASGCERNWSTFEYIHSKKRNRLTQERLNDLVYVHYNLRLRHRMLQRTTFEAIDLDDIDPSDPHAEWVANFQPEDFDPMGDFPMHDAEALEQEAIAMGEEEERARAERARAERPSEEEASASASQVHQQEQPMATRTRLPRQAQEKLKKKV